MTKFLLGALYNALIGYFGLVLIGFAQREYMFAQDTLFSDAHTAGMYAVSFVALIGVLLFGAFVHAYLTPARLLDRLHTVLIAAGLAWGLNTLLTIPFMQGQDLSPYLPFFLVPCAALGSITGALLGAAKRPVPNNAA